MFARFQIADGSIDDLPRSGTRSSRGLYAMVLPIVICAFGAAGEAAVWHELTERTQKAADAAAIAAARQRAIGDLEGAGAAGAQAAANSGFVADRNGTRVAIEPLRDGSAVEARVSHVFSPIVSAVFPAASFTVTSRAVAGVRIEGASCVVTLQGANGRQVDAQVPAEAGSTECRIPDSALAAVAKGGIKGTP